MKVSIFVEYHRGLKESKERRSMRTLTYHGDMGEEGKRWRNGQEETAST
jgi:hypothetical protein